jgi:ribosome-associated translation inhibitor RaiA
LKSCKSRSTAATISKATTVSTSGSAPRCTAAERYEEDLTRIEVHLRDENGAKPGPHDKRCQMEARPKGHQPISVTHTATSLDQAVDGAANKLNHALEHFYGKLRSKRGVLELSDPDA